MNSYRVVALYCGFGALTFIGGTLLGDQGGDEPTAEERAANLARMDRLADSIQIAEIVEDERHPVARQKLPLLRYNDNTRMQPDGSMWIWLRHNRPVAIVGIELYPRQPRGMQTLFELVSLSDHRIAAVRDSELHWTAKSAADDWRPLPDAVIPAKSPTGRMVQMKEGQRGFQAWENSIIGGRIELRPLITPLLRYDDATTGVLDGAIFAWANGTNPEILLIMEARQAAGAAAAWQYRLAQMAGAEVTVERDGKAVWKRGNADPPAERPSYVNGWIVETASKDAPPAKAARNP